MPIPDVDVAIVGGGIAGIYSAWRICTSTPVPGSALGAWGHDRRAGKPIVRVFESSKRVGGRLLSLTPPGMPHIRCELGGMRYMSSQPLIAALVEGQLQLAHVELPADRPENLAFLRGKRLRQSQLTDPHRVPYNVDWAERGRNPQALLGFAIDQLLPGTSTTPMSTLLEKLRSASVDGRPVWQWGFWNLVARGMSSEAYQLAVATSGYDLIGLNWNALDTIHLNFGDFGSAVQYRRVVDGYHSVPRLLASRFQDAGGRVELGHDLSSFVDVRLDDGTAGFELRFRDIEQPVYARAIVLAMPRAAIERLQHVGPLLDESARETWTLLRAVEPVPLLKLFLGFEQPWWTNIGIAAGRSVTDLPIRQCYYWGVEGQQPGGAQSNMNAAMLATYDDTIHAGFWRGLESQPHSPVFATRATPHGAVESDDWADYAPSQAMVDEAMRELQELHGMRSIPPPYCAAYRDWSQEPFGGGAWFWRPGVKSWECIPRAIQPVDGVHAYICGESYSGNQGWVEGALETSELMLARLGAGL
jgi:monoamine oxidase